MKKASRTSLLAAMTVAAGLFLAPAAHADQGDYHGDDYRQHAEDHHHHYDIRDEDRHRIHDYINVHHHLRCPHEECRHEDFYNRGAFLPHDVVYEPLPRDIVVRLAPPPPGAVYVNVGDNAYLMDQGSREILDGISLNVNIH